MGNILNRKRVICCALYIALFTAAILPVLSRGAAAAKDKKPNFILIVTDDQGWIDLSEPIDPDYPNACCKYFNTPRINELAREGMRFTGAYSPASVCTPSRRSIQFGMTPARQHATEFVGEFDPTGKWSIPQALKQADPDYKCAHFGKWGGVITGTWDDKDSQKPGFPDNLGYDISDGPTGNPDGDVEGGHYIDNIKPEEFTGQTEKYVTIEHEDPKLTFSINSRAISFMEQMVRENKPFFMQVSYYAIHLRIQALKETIDKFKDKNMPDRKIFPGIGPMLEDLDTAIGELLDAINELGISDNTYIIMISDNGGQFNRGDFWESGLPKRTTPYKEGESHLWKLPMTSAELDRNYPLREAKGTLYEGGIRVPMIMLGPGIMAGSICRVPVAGYDFLPTIYDLAGGTKKIPQVLDGGSLKNILENNGKGKVQRPIDGLVFHQNNPEQDKFYSVFREGILKLVVTKNSKGEIINSELFNLSKDISESMNLAEKIPRKSKKLREKLFAYLNEIE